MKRLSVFMLSVVLLVSAHGAEAARPTAPTLVIPPQGGAVDERLPRIAGVAPENVGVIVYVDGKRYATVSTTGTEGGTKSFVTHTTTNDTPLSYGEHTATAVSVVNGVKSIESEPITFVVERKAIAPALLQTVVNDTSSYARPWITGIAPVGSYVDVWVDGVYHGTDMVEGNEALGSFAVRPAFDLSVGEHEVRAIARTERADGSMRHSNASSETVTVTAAPTAETTSTEETTTSEEGQQEEVNESGSESSQEEQANESASSEETSMSNEEGSSEEAMSSEEGEEGAAPDDNDDEESEEDEDEEGEQSSDFLSTVGWIALLVAALIVVMQLQRRRVDVDDVLVDNATKSDDNDGKKFSFKADAPKENKNIEVIKKDDNSDNAN